jgi:hypothetical protein
LIPAFADHLIADDHHSADRHFVAPLGALSQRERASHELDIPRLT